MVPLDIMLTEYTGKGGPAKQVELYIGDNCFMVSWEGSMPDRKPDDFEEDVPATLLTDGIRIDLEREMAGGTAVVSIWNLKEPEADDLLFEGASSASTEEIYERLRQS